MDGIFKFFTSLGDIIKAVVDFIVNLFKDLVYALNLMKMILVKFPSLLTGWLPPAVISIAVVLIGIVIVYKIIGRD